MQTLKQYILSRRGLMLLLALTAVPLFYGAFLLFFGTVLLFEAFPKHPFLCTLILLALCFLTYLCFVGSKMESRLGVYFVTRLFLLLLSETAGLLSAELLWVGAITLGVAHSGHGASLEDYLPLVGALGFVALFAAGIKYVFNLRFRFWIIFLVSLLAVSIAIFRANLTVLLAYLRLL